MKPTDDLFQLIKSLTEEEKRYFKKYVSLFSGTRGKVFTRLFNVIGHQEEYDEQELVSHLSKTKTGKQFTQTKHYLYLAILASQRNIKQQKNALKGTKNPLEIIEVLLQRGLYQPALARAESLEKELAGNGIFPNNLYRVRQIKRQILRILTPRGYERAIQQSYSDTVKELEVEKYRTQMTKLSHELTFYSINVGTMRSDEQKKGLQAFIDTPLFQSGFTTKDFKAKLSWSNLGYRIYTLMGDFENAMQFGKAALGAWDTHPLFKQAQLQRYMGQLGNLLELCFALGRISEARQYMEILSNADADEPTKVLRKLSYASYFGMELLTAEKKFDELYSYCQEVAPKLENAGTKMGLHHLLWNYFRLTASYFITGHYEEALDAAAKVLAEENFAGMKHHRATTRLIQLMIYLEMGNDEMLEHVVLSAQRYLKSRQYFYELEKHFLQFFSKLSHEYNEKDRLPIYRKMHEDLLQLVNDDPDQRTPLQWFNLLCWVEAKAKGKQLKEVYRHANFSKNYEAVKN